MDSATYELIKPAYERVEKLEPFIVGAGPVSEIAILSASARPPQATIESAASPTMARRQIPNRRVITTPIEKG